jgi:hypothetical protein
MPNVADTGLVSLSALPAHGRERAVRGTAKRRGNSVAQWKVGQS